MQKEKSITITINELGVPIIDKPKDMSATELLGMIQMFEKLVLIDLLDKFKQH